MDYKFRVEFLQEAKDFLDSLDEKSRAKIIYNIWKSRNANDKELFKKLQDEIWEFRTLYNKTYYRLFAIFIKSNSFLFKKQIIPLLIAFAKRKVKTNPKYGINISVINQINFAVEFRGLLKKKLKKWNKSQR